MEWWGGGGGGVCSFPTLSGDKTYQLGITTSKLKMSSRNDIGSISAALSSPTLFHSPNSGWQSSLVMSLIVFRVDNSDVKMTGMLAFPYKR